MGSRVDRRDELQQVALRLFLDGGFAGTSVRQIATEGGVTVPALYYHFDSKDGLLSTLVEGLVADGERVLAELSTGDRNRGAEQALGAYYDVVTDHLDVFRLVMTDPSVRSHEVAGHRLADQGVRFLTLLTDGSDREHDLIRANAALGAIRRPMRLAIFDAVRDRPQILASAMAALQARP